MINYHTHTFRCKHAYGTDEEFVEAAIRAGFTTLGFADHCPWRFEDGHVSAMRMLPEQLAGYYASLASLRDRYADTIDIKIGLECEFSPLAAKAHDELLDSVPLDYRILAQHYLVPDKEMISVVPPTTDEKNLAFYVDTCIEALATGKYLYIAHPDIMNYVGDAAIYKKHYARLCLFLKRKNIPAEINLGGLSTGRYYPNRQFWEIVAECGCSAIIGYDAHWPKNLVETKFADQARKLAAEYSIPLIDKPMI